MTASLQEPSRAALEEAKRKLAGRRDVRERLAFAECCFRLAVMPDTEIEAAIELMREAANCDPYHPKYWFHLGRLLHKNGDPQGAVTQYLRALKQVPKNHRILVHLALALKDLDSERRKMGMQILTGLQAGDDATMAGLVAELEAGLEQNAERKPGKATATGAKEDEEKKPGDSASGKSRWKGLWQLQLLNLLTRAKPKLKDAEKRLKEGKTLEESGRGVSEYAVATLFFALDGPKSCRQIEGWLREPALASHQDRPAIRLVRAVCELGSTETGEEFVTQAAVRMQEGELPPELVCALHYCWHGGSTKDAVQATALIDSYPEAIRSLDCFRELRLALLDDYARAEWAADRLDRAEILWRETIRLDPFRIPVAHNLAIAATKAKSPEKYAVAWDRAAELRYLLAASAGDLRVELDERCRLHRSFAQQSRLRYAPDSGSSSKKPTDEQLRAWMKDKEALDIWLHEGELLYLNSRLRFRSAIHILGVTKDCSAEDADLAKGILMRQFEMCFRGKRWAGSQAFLHLAEQMAEGACNQAKDPVARNRDTYFVTEETEAFKLASETVLRGFLMFDMIRLAASSEEATLKRAGLEVARFLLNLPWRQLAPVAAKNGYQPSDADELLPIFLSYVLGLVPNLENDKVGADAAAGALEDCIRAQPDSVTLRLVMCRLLLGAKRNHQAYEAALAAIPLVAKMADRKEAGQLEKQLVICVDNAALAELPERFLSPSRADVPAVVREGRRVLVDFPRAGGLRNLIADYLIQTADEDAGRLNEATVLLEEGLDLFLAEEQILEARRLLDKAGSRSRSPDAVNRIRSLLESASAHARSAVAMVREDRSPAKARQARAELEAGLTEASQAEEIADSAQLPAAAQRARELAADLRKILDSIEGQ